MLVTPLNTISDCTTPPSWFCRPRPIAHVSGTLSSNVRIWFALVMTVGLRLSDMYAPGCAAGGLTRKKQRPLKDATHVGGATSAVGAVFPALHAGAAGLVMSSTPKKLPPAPVKPGCETMIL